MSLFRKEVLDRKRDDLLGSVDILAPTTWNEILVVVFIIPALTATIFGFIPYAKSISLDAVLLPEAQLVAIVPRQIGTIRKLLVREGETVRVGQKLAIVDIQDGGAGGGKQPRKATAFTMVTYPLVSPIRGRIASIAIREGDLIGADTATMVIEPQGRELRAQLFVPPDAAQFVFPGKQLLLTAGDSAADRSATVPAVVDSISPAPVVRAGATHKALVYVAVAKVRSSKVRSQTDLVTTLAGTTFKAKIVTERRPIAAWLFEPFVAKKIRR